MDVKRRDICLVDLGFTQGSEQNGVRPCLIVSNDIGNIHSTTVIICPITTRLTGYNKTHVNIDCLQYPSTIMCEQIRTIDKRRIINRITKLDADTMEEVREKIMLTLSL